MWCVFVVGIAEEDKIGAVGNIHAAITGRNARWNEKSVSIDRGFVGAAFTVGVFEDDHLVVLRLARFDLRVGFAAREPKSAGGVEVHLDRLGEERVGGEEVDLETVGDLERLALDLRIGIDVLRSVCLGVK
jgi:hypothetical protein